jgi:GNAT superfamily N-acetyltransferase
MKPARALTTREPHHLLMATDVTVRRASAADLARVAGIKVANWADTYAQLLEPEVLTRFLDVDVQHSELSEEFAEPGTLLLVAERPDAGIIGFALTHADRRPEPWLESLHTVRNARGTGAGTALMRATASELLAEGHRALSLGVIEGNHAAVRFYERLGAAHAGREPAAWAEGVWHEILRWSDLETLTISPG